MNPASFVDAFNQFVKELFFHLVARKTTASSVRQWRMATPTREVAEGAYSDAGEPPVRYGIVGM
jgi:hypothetical protein